MAATVTIGLGGASLEGTASVTRSPARQSSAGHGGRSSASKDRSVLEVSTKDLRSIEARIARRGLRVRERQQADGATCSEHAYGQVRHFFNANECTSLRRAQLQVGNKKGDVVLVAISWVKMPTTSTANEYKKLVDIYGTGNVVELSRESGRYRIVRYTGQRYKSWQRGRVVANAQAEPIGRGLAGLALAAAICRNDF